MSQHNREGFSAIVDGLKAKFGTLNDDQLGRLRQKARQNYGLTAQETEQILEDSGLTVINYFEALELTIEELENHSEETVKKRVEDAWFPRYNQALNDHTDRGVESRDLLNKAKNILIDPQKRQIHIAQIKSISEPDPIITFRTGEAATSVGELVSLMEKHSVEAAAALYRNEIAQGLDRLGEKHFADVGRAVVGQFSADRRTGFMAMIAVLRGKMRLENGSEAGTPQELARLIDQDWEKSKGLLYNGFIAFWLEHTQRSHFASIAKDITNRYRSKQDVGLEAFVQKLDPKIGKPKLQVYPSQIDFGSMDTESQKTVDIKITNVGRGFLYSDVQLSTDIPGLQVSGTEIQGGGVVSVKLDASRLPPNKAHQTALVFNTNSGTLRVPVSYSIKPKATNVLPDPVPKSDPVPKGDGMLLQQSVQRVAISGFSVAAIALVTRLIIQQFGISEWLAGTSFTGWKRHWRLVEWFEWPWLGWKVYTLSAPGAGLGFVIAFVSLGVGIFSYWYFFFKKKRVR